MFVVPKSIPMPTRCTVSRRRRSRAHRRARSAFDRRAIETEPVRQHDLVVLRPGAEKRRARRSSPSEKRYGDCTTGRLPPAPSSTCVIVPRCLTVGSSSVCAPSRTSPHARFMPSSALITASRFGRFLKNARAVARRIAIFSSSDAFSGVGSTSPPRVTSCFHTWRKSLAINSVPGRRVPHFARHRLEMFGMVDRVMQTHRP